MSTTIKTLDYHQIATLIQDFHAARALTNSRYERILYAVDEFILQNPEISRMSVYKQLTRAIG